MPSSFFGLTIASSGLNAYQAAINTTANNISNIQTDGYSKQEVTLEASSSLRAFQKYGTTGTGVTAKEVIQLRDEYYDDKYWNNQSKYGEYDKKLYYMEQVEDYFTDDSDTGFTTLYSKMFNALSSLYSSPGDTSIRNEFISDSSELMQYFNGTATNLQELQSTINDEIKSTVDNVNSIAQKIASLNKQINNIEMSGSNANDLRDARALLIDELSEIVPVEVNETDVANSNYPNMDTGATYFTVKLNGRMLVDTYEYNTLDTKTREYKDNQCDIDGLYDVIWSDSGAELDVNSKTMSGSLKALFQMRDGNNGENLKGTVFTSDSTHIELQGLSTTEINELNLPTSGTLTVNNKEYNYDGFSFNLNEDGEIESLTLDLITPISADVESEIAGRTVTVGSTVDYKGIAYYQNQMSTFLRNFAEQFNDIEQSGVDYNGDAMNSFIVCTDIQGEEIQFEDSGDYAKQLNADGTVKTRTDAAGNTVDSGTYTQYSNSPSDFTYYQMTALNVQIANASATNPKIFATTADPTTGIDDASLVSDLLELQSDTTIYKGCGGDDFLQCIYADITVDTQQCSVFKDTYGNIQNTIDEQRTSISGVDEDEEAMDLVKFQNAYNLSSKCISVLSEMYEQLILNTGV